jgi:Gluconate 2-dehydrogenase subunit 3
MSHPSRRLFVGWLGGLAAALGLRTGSPSGLLSGNAPDVDRVDGDEPREQGVGLDVATLTRIGEVVLPSELGAAGIARVSRAFAAWIAGFKPGAELVHPYGSADLRFAGTSPLPRWRQQITALQSAARTAHGRGFTAVTRDQREALLRTALANERIDRMPSPLNANHVALALVAYYFGSAEATDLCYRAQIGQNQCRPLVNSPREPLPLARSGPGLGAGQAGRAGEGAGS